MDVEIISVIEKLITSPIAFKRGLETKSIISNKYNRLVMTVFITNFFSLLVAISNDTNTPSK